MKKLSYKALYIAWAAMFALTAALGFVYPNTEGIAPRLIAAAYFLAPWAVLRKAKAENNRFHIRIVVLMALAALVLTTVLLVLNLMSACWSVNVGNALNAALTVVSAPMIYSNLFALPYFFWGCLLADAFVKK